MPKKINVMRNFLQCSMAIFGDKGKYCITFKKDQTDFQLFQRKYLHDFKVHVSVHDYERAFGLSVDEIGQFLVASRGNIYCFDSYNYKLLQKLDDVASVRRHRHGAMRNQDDI